MFVFKFVSKSNYMKRINEININRLGLFDKDMSGVPVCNEPLRCNHLIFVLCKKGRVVVEVNYTTYVLKAGELFLLTPYDIFFLKEYDDNSLLRILVIPKYIQEKSFYEIDISSFESITRMPQIRFSEEYFEVVDSIFSLLHRLDSMLEYESFSVIAEKQIASIFNMIKLHYSRNNGSSAVGRKYVSRKKELFGKFIKELLNSHSVSREVLFYANELGVSSGYLNEICNEVYKHSAKEIIDSAVTTRLKHELSYTTKSIQELADEYNFPSQSYLSRYYKRMTGKTPSEFRKGS